jgi:hypothetical protein
LQRQPSYSQSGRPRHCGEATSAMKCIGRMEEVINVMVFRPQTSRLGRQNRELALDAPSGCE